MIIQVCVGSSCYLRGSNEIVERMREALEQRRLENEVTLAGCFCAGKCNRVGVTVQVDDEIYTGVTPESFPTFFAENVLKKLHA